MTNNYGGGALTISMIFLSGPTLLIKLICVGFASRSGYLKKMLCVFLSIGDLHGEQNLGISFLRANQGYYTLALIFSLKCRQPVTIAT